MKDGIELSIALCTYQTKRKSYLKSCLKDLPNSPNKLPTTSVNYTESCVEKRPMDSITITTDLLDLIGDAE